MGEQGTLFHVEVPERPEKPKGRRWGGNDSRAARSIVRGMLPSPCTRCGRTVTEDMEWHADHIQEHAFGGASNASNYGPAHAKCNTSAGGKIGARMTNGHKQEQNNSHRERTVKWW